MARKRHSDEDVLKLLREIELKLTASTLIREYIWLNGQVIGVIEGGELFYVRTDHIGRPVFATNDLGLKVWEATRKSSKILLGNGISNPRNFVRLLIPCG